MKGFLPVALLVMILCAVPSFGFVPVESGVSFRGIVNAKILGRKWLSTARDQATRDQSVATSLASIDSNEGSDVDGAEVETFLKSSGKAREYFLQVQMHQFSRNELQVHADSAWMLSAEDAKDEFQRIAGDASRVTPSQAASAYLQGAIAGGASRVTPSQAASAYLQGFPRPAIVENLRSKLAATAAACAGPDGRLGEADFLRFTMRRLTMTEEAGTDLESRGKELWGKVRAAVAGGGLRGGVLRPEVDAEEAVRMWKCAYAGRSDYY
eukprot:CAMPEP_0196757384 /NCGR_PEP_ID=MMETSP1091-20130531/103635_1 /TAXON_ID=302021 /ORGANISM="Rhodomonas sp., Strain CCMP768" /LENGTH=267 /DNA_ID=CAMNT_0042106157 /DNA_START=54 /DNA_END=859 /DNA_ORIENTATION=+